MTEKLVCMENVGCTYLRGNTPVEAVKSATCTVMPGDRIALVGPSGSGKSTLLHIMGGLERNTSGSIRWPLLGSRETLIPGKIGFIFQTQSLFSSLTVEENVALPLLLGDYDPAVAHTAALDIISRLGMDELAGKLPEELSGGQAQRVAVARALVFRPRLVIADEPTGQLDNATARHMLDVLLDFLEGSDTALLVATHDLSVANRMSVIWQIKHGVLEVSI